MGSRVLINANWYNHHSARKSDRLALARSPLIGDKIRRSTGPIV